MSSPDPLISINEVAEMLGMSVSWVRKRTRAHDIPHVPLGARTKYRTTDIEAYIASHTVGAQ